MTRFRCFPPGAVTETGDVAAGANDADKLTGVLMRAKCGTGLTVVGSGVPSLSTNAGAIGTGAGVGSAAGGAGAANDVVKFTAVAAAGLQVGLT